MISRDPGLQSMKDRCFYLVSIVFKGSEGAPGVPVLACLLIWRPVCISFRSF